jgi:hypothetical protein
MHLKQKTAITWITPDDVVRSDNALSFLCLAMCAEQMYYDKNRGPNIQCKKKLKTTGKIQRMKKCYVAGKYGVFYHVTENHS